jgi:hypothetical protein
LTEYIFSKVSVLFTSFIVTCEVKIESCLFESWYQELPHGKWFCRRECRSIHSALRNLIADGARRLPGSVLDIIRKKHEETASEDNFDLNITWKLLHGKTASEEDRKWLSDAVSVFHVST